MPCRSCGCHWNPKDGVVHCCLHAAALQLLEACEAASKWMTPVLEGFGVEDLPASHPVHQANAAIAAAKREEPDADNHRSAGDDYARHLQAGYEPHDED